MMIQAVADAHNLRVIADGAQAFGGKDNGRWVGNIAEITATSFYPTKTLGGYGDGGAILCQDKDWRLNRVVDRKVGQHFQEPQWRSATIARRSLPNR